MPGSTPLHDAALKGQTEVARVLLAHGADAKVKRLDGATPLHDAALGRYAGVTELLLGTWSGDQCRGCIGDHPS
jgi:ankyrin repeat protein